MIFKLSTKENNAPVIEVKVIRDGMIECGLVLGQVYDLILAAEDHSDCVSDFDFLNRLQEHYLNQKVLMTRNFVAVNMSLMAEKYDLKLESF